MKKFVFSLGKVLQLKDQMLESEKHTLAELQLEGTKLELALEQSWADFQAWNQRIEETTRKGVSLLELRSLRFQLDSIRSDINELTARKEQQEQRIEAQRQVVVALSQEVNSLEKLKEHQMESYNQENEKAERESIAEFVAGKLVRQQQAL